MKKKIKLWENELLSCAETKQVGVQKGNSRSFVPEIISTSLKRPPL